MTKLAENVRELVHLDWDIKKTVIARPLTFVWYNAQKLNHVWQEIIYALIFMVMMENIDAMKEITNVVLIVRSLIADCYAQTCQVIQN